MSTNYYAGWEIDELLKERRRIQERLSRGNQTEVSSAGNRGVKEFKTSPEVLLENVSYALSLKDPVAYPFTPRYSRTKAIVYG